MTTPPTEVPATPTPAPAPSLATSLYPNGSVEGTNDLKVGADGEAIPSTPPVVAPPVVDDKPLIPAPEAAPPAAEPSADAPVSPPSPLTAESYADLKVPDTIQVDAALFTDFKTTLADVGVDPSKAPALLSLYEKALTAQQSATVEAIKAQDAKWRTELDAIPEFQGERRAQASTAIGKLLEEFGTAEVRSTLDAYGLGNNPALARMLHKVALALQEGAPTPVGSPPPTSRDGRPLSRTLGGKLYGSAPKQ